MRTADAVAKQARTVLVETEEELPWKAKILLVDDNHQNLLALEAVLDHPDHDLVKATSGREALRYLLADDFAAILLDVKMPEMDGFETASLIRARKRSQHTPILFLTAYKGEEQLSRGYDLGAVDFLFKPIVPEILRSKVNAFVQLSRKSELLERQTGVLRRAEQKFRALLEAAPDAMVITGPIGHIDLVNNRAQRLFDLRRDQLRDEVITRLVPEWSESLGSHADNLYGLRSDGLRFPIEVTCSPLQTTEGRITIYAIRDITDRKRAESQIRELNLLLEQKVRERTAELTRSNDDLAQFAYVASHDLKEPLRTIAIFTELLDQEHGESLNPQAQEGLTYILSGVRRMHELIDDLLAYSQVESRESNVKPVDLNAVVQEALFNLHRVIQEAGAEVTADPLPTVTGDRVQLTQLLQNLVGNSIKYRSKESPRIHISFALDVFENVISVRDNGIGIDPRYAESVFKLFKRLHVREEYPGNGVGLAICRRIVERHGGRIWIESDGATGSTFHFTMPASK